MGVRCWRVSVCVRSWNATGPRVRCALGWALHNDLEVARCAATDVVTDCWKEHPERTPVVVLPGAEASEVDAEGPSRHVAGD